MSAPTQTRDPYPDALRACALIQDGRLAICEIAASVGYESRHAFSRSFKRATGLTATRFRSAGGVR